MAMKGTIRRNPSERSKGFSYTNTITFSIVSSRIRNGKAAGTAVRQLGFLGYSNAKAKSVQTTIHRNMQQPKASINPRNSNIPCTLISIILVPLGIRFVFRPSGKPIRILFRIAHPSSPRLSVDHPANRRETAQSHLQFLHRTRGLNHA